MLRTYALLLVAAPTMPLALPPKRKNPGVAHGWWRQEEWWVRWWLFLWRCGLCDWLTSELMFAARKNSENSESSGDPEWCRPGILYQETYGRRWRWRSFTATKTPLLWIWIWIVSWHGPRTEASHRLTDTSSIRLTGRSTQVPTVLHVSGWRKSRHLVNVRNNDCSSFVVDIDSRRLGAKCRSMQSIRKGSFFENSRLFIDDIFCVTFCWAAKLSVKSTAIMVCVSAWILFLNGYFFRDCVTFL